MAAMRSTVITHSVKRSVIRLKVLQRRPIPRADIAAEEVMTMEKIKWKGRVAQLMPVVTLVGLVATIGAGVKWA